MNKIVKKAIEMDQYNNSLPDVKEGETIGLGEIWDGIGDMPEDSWSIKITDSDWINYTFEIVEEKDDPLGTLVRITDIELL